MDVESENSTFISNTHLKITYLKSPGWVKEHIDDYGAIRLGGPLGELLQMLSTFMGFTYVLSKPKEASYGRKLSNGTWTGVVGEVKNEEVDIALTPITVSNSRRAVIEFSNLISMSRTAILSGAAPKRSPTTDQTSDLLFSIADGADWMVWLFLFISSILIIVSAAIISRQSLTQSKGMQNNRSVTDAKQGIISAILSYTIVVFGIIVHSGPAMRIRKEAMMIVMGSFLLGTMLFTIFLLSQFHTDLVQVTKVQFVESREQLAKSKIYPCINGNGIFQDLFETNSEDPLYAGIWKIISSRKKEMLITNTDMTSPKFLSKIARGTHAFINYEINLIGMGNQICKLNPKAMLHISREKFFINSRTLIIMRKTLDKKLKKRINFVVNQVLETGIFDFWYKEVAQANRTCIDSHLGQSSSADEMESVTLDLFRWLLKTLLASFFTSFLVLAIECFVFKQAPFRESVCK